MVEINAGRGTRDGDSRAIMAIMAIITSFSLTAKKKTPSHWHSPLIPNYFWFKSIHMAPPFFFSFFLLNLKIVPETLNNN